MSYPNTSTEKRAFNSQEKPRRPYDPTDNKTRGYKNLYAIYPDYWKQSWGQRPILGYVRADSVFHAKYAAYDASLLIVNATFGPEPVLQIRKPYRPESKYVVQHTDRNGS
jgi:hypothetical protein